MLTESPPILPTRPSGANSVGSRSLSFLPGALLSSALFNRPQQLVESFGKKLDAVVGQLVGIFLHRNARSRQIVHGFFCAGYILGQTLPQFAMIAKGVDCRRRHCVNRIGSDEFLDIENVAVRRILCAGAGPEHTLRL